MPSLVVIGASAGGVSGLLTIARDLPASLAAAVLVVVHVGQGPTVLPDLLNGNGPLPAAHTVDGERYEAGRIYVAPPDFHLMVRNGRLELFRGPRENHTRPAIDPLFRSAARARGADVIGVILSGALSDGAAGAMAITDRGGKVIVQDPKEAFMSGMPSSAIRSVDVAAVLPVAEIAGAIEHLVRQRELGDERRGRAMADEFEKTKAAIAEDMEEQANDQRSGDLTLFTCPDCGGSLWQSTSEQLLSFECHVGHTFSWESLVGQKSEQLETALWASVRLLVERATLNRQISTRSRASHGAELAQRFEEQAARDQAYADTLRELLERLPSPILEARSLRSETAD
jgi:two-component system chemotaxis response regulator CheB